MRALVTGGAGFIGSHIVDALIRDHHDVRVVDSLVPEVHGQLLELRTTCPPAYLNPAATFTYGDVCDAGLMSDLVSDVDAVFYCAGRMGIERSIREPSLFLFENVCGLAMTLEAIVRRAGAKPTLVLSSSMGVYGDAPVPVSEDARCVNLTSVYSMTKFDQELVLRIVAARAHVPAVILRYFNVYGPRQSGTNPYGGVVAKFVEAARRDVPPLVFEDGKQTRDFVSVHDVVRANVLALNKASDAVPAFNVGSGKATRILDLARLVLELSGRDQEPVVTETFEYGQIRHSCADLTFAKQALGYEPTVSLRDGIHELIS